MKADEGKSKMKRDSAVAGGEFLPCPKCGKWWTYSEKIVDGYPTGECTGMGACGYRWTDRTGMPTIEEMKNDKCTHYVPRNKAPHKKSQEYSDWQMMMADRVTVRREELGLTKADVDKMCRKQRGTTGRVEAGLAGRDIVEVVCKALGVTLHE